MKELHADRQDIIDLHLEILNRTLELRGMESYPPTKQSSNQG